MSDTYYKIALVEGSQEWKPPVQTTESFNIYRLCPTEHSLRVYLDPVDPDLWFNLPKGRTIEVKIWTYWKGLDRSKLITEPSVRVLE